MAAGKAPTRRIEQELWGQGHQFVVGIDEVGRGAWAGPLMVGAAILPRDSRVLGVRDSKLLTEANRERLFERIAAWCVSWSVGSVSQAECDEMGMAAAQKLACRRAVEGLTVAPDVAVSDGKWDFVSPCVERVEMRVKADRHCLSVAAASILAKVVRDRHMRELDELYPGYGLAGNKGYGTRQHLQALERLGVSPVHRRSFAPVAERLQDLLFPRELP